jgi:hypothetical protein
MNRKYNGMNNADHGRKVRVGVSTGMHVPRKIFEISSPEMLFPASEFVLRFVLTVRSCISDKNNENAQKIQTLFTKSSIRKRHSKCTTCPSICDLKRTNANSNSLFSRRPDGAVLHA